MKTEKVYRYLYDPSTYLYSGIISGVKPEHSTDVKPHFESGFKTIYDKKLKKWKLIEQREYFELIGSMNKQLEFETDIKNFISENMSLVVNTLATPIIKQTDHISELSTHVIKSTNDHIKDIKHVEKLVDYGNNQGTRYHAEIMKEFSTMVEVHRTLVGQINNLNVTLNYIKFEMDLPIHRRFFRWLGRVLF